MADTPTIYVDKDIDDIDEDDDVAARCRGCCWLSISTNYFAASSLPQICQQHAYTIHEEKYLADIIYERPHY